MNYDMKKEKKWIMICEKIRKNYIILYYKYKYIII